MMTPDEVREIEQSVCDPADPYLIANAPEWLRRLIADWWEMQETIARKQKVVDAADSMTQATLPKLDRIEGNMHALIAERDELQAQITRDCKYHGRLELNAWGCAECTSSLRAELDAKEQQRIRDNTYLIAERDEVRAALAHVWNSWTTGRHGPHVPCAYCKLAREVSEQEAKR